MNYSSHRSFFVGLLTTDRQKLIDLLNKSITSKGTLLSNLILMIYLIIMDVIFQRLLSIFLARYLKINFMPGNGQKAELLLHRI